MGQFDNLIMAGRLYLPLLLIDADERVVGMRMPHTEPSPGTHLVQPYICTDCMAMTVDPKQHNTVHDGPACRVCGCTEENACVLDDPEGRGLSTCFWMEPDLCSNPDCVKAAEPQREAQVVDLVASLRASVESAKQRRKEQGRG